MNRQKIILLAAVALLLGALLALDMGQYLTLDSIKAHQGEFALLYARHRLAVIGTFFLIYVVSTALSLPGALSLTLLAGGLFGFWTSLVVVSFASSLGATLACMASRFVLRDWVQHRFGPKLQTVNRGFEKEGAFYLFTLRLIPVVPFFLLNLGMGLTPLRIKTFYWVSQAGMLPGTAAYVFAGQELARIDSLKGILNPGLIAAFVVIGLLPLVAKRGIEAIKRRRGTTGPWSS